MASLYTKLFHHGPINVDDIMSNLIEKYKNELYKNADIYLFFPADCTKKRKMIIEI